MRRNSYFILLAGVGLVAISCVWPSLVGGTHSWSDEQAESYAQAAAALHTLTYKAAQAQEMAQQSAKNPQLVLADKQLTTAAANGKAIDPATATADRMATQLAAAKERYQHERAQFEAARSHGQGAAAVMRWLGVFLVAAGLIVRLRQSNSGT